MHKVLHYMMLVIDQKIIDLKIFFSAISLIAVYLRGSIRYLSPAGVI